MAADGNRHSFCIYSNLNLLLKTVWTEHQLESNMQGSQETIFNAKSWILLANAVLPKWEANLLVTWSLQIATNFIGKLI